MQIKVSKTRFPIQSEGFYVVLIPVMHHITGYNQQINVGPYRHEFLVCDAVKYIHNAIVDSSHKDSEFNLLKTRLDAICEWPVDEHSENCADLQSYSVKYVDSQGFEYPVQVLFDE